MYMFESLGLRRGLRVQGSQREREREIERGRAREI